MKTQSQLLDVDELLTLVLLQVLLDPLGQLALLHHNSRPLQLLTTFGLVLPTSLSLDTGGALVETLHQSITCQVITSKTRTSTWHHHKQQPIKGQPPALTSSAMTPLWWGEDYPQTRDFNQKLAADNAGQS